jgi:hypothetical protein
VRSHLTLVQTSASTTDTATGICVRFKVDTEVDGSGDKALYFAKYLAARALQASFLKSPLSGGFTEEMYTGTDFSEIWSRLRYGMQTRTFPSAVLRYASVK